jgi:DNA (cytosine-5)-methyltransferase 1
MWGEALRVVADLCPRFFVAENPIGLLNHDGGRTFHGILRAFASVGYVCEWHVIAAADVGAPHRRERVWLVAHSDSVPRTKGQSRRAGGRVSGSSAGPQGREDQGQAWAVAGDCRADVADANSRRRKRQRLTKHSDQQGSSRHLPDGRSSWGRWARPSECGRHWSAEPELGRLAYGIPNRVERLRCLGNAVVPQVAEVIGRAIIAMENEAQA